MKSLLKLFTVVILITMLSCRDTKKEEAQTNAMIEQIEAVENDVDSISEDIDAKAEELEEAIKELDSI